MLQDRHVVILSGFHHPTHVGITRIAGNLQLETAQGAIADAAIDFGAHGLFAELRVEATKAGDKPAANFNDRDHLVVENPRLFLIG